MTYPADGASGVPTDAKLFILNNAFQVTMEAQPLVEIESGVWDPGPLQPNRPYEFTVVAEGWDARIGEGPFTASYSFTTGASPSSHMESGGDVSASVCAAENHPLLDERCYRTVPFDCLDDCDVRFAEADLRGEDVVAWRLRWRDSDGLLLTSCDGRWGRSYCPQPQDQEFEAVAYAANGDVLGMFSWASLPASCSAVDGGANSEAHDGGCCVDGGRPPAMDAGLGVTPDGGQTDGGAPYCACGELPDAPPVGLMVIGALAGSMLVRRRRTGDLGRQQSKSLTEPAGRLLR